MKFFMGALSFGSIFLSSLLANASLLEQTTAPLQDKLNTPVYVESLKSYGKLISVSSSWNPFKTDGATVQLQSGTQTLIPLKDDKGGFYERAGIYSGEGCDSHQVCVGDRAAILGQYGLHNFVVEGKVLGRDFYHQDFFIAQITKGNGPLKAGDLAWGPAMPTKGKLAGYSRGDYAVELSDPYQIDSDAYDSWYKIANVQAVKASGVVVGAFDFTDLENHSHQVVAIRNLGNDILVNPSQIQSQKFSDLASQGGTANCPILVGYYTCKSPDSEGQASISQFISQMGMRYEFRFADNGRDTFNADIPTHVTAGQAVDGVGKDFACGDNHSVVVQEKDSTSYTISKTISLDVSGNLKYEIKERQPGALEDTITNFFCTKN